MLHRIVCCVASALYYSEGYGTRARVPNRKQSRNSTTSYSHITFPRHQYLIHNIYIIIIIITKLLWCYYAASNGIVVNQAGCHGFEPWDRLTRLPTGLWGSPSVMDTWYPQLVKLKACQAWCLSHYPIRVPYAKIIKPPPH